MKFATVIKELAAYLTGSGAEEFVPEMWRDGCGAVFISGRAETVCTYVDGSAVVRLPIEVRVRCDALGEGDRIRTLQIFDKITQYAEHTPFSGFDALFEVKECARKDKSHSAGVDEYVLPCALIYHISADGI